MGPAERKRRGLRWALLVALGVLVVGGAGTLGWAQIRVARLERDLVEGAVEAAASSHVRPSHAEQVEPGTLWDHFEAKRSELHEVTSALDALPKDRFHACAQVRAGALPTSRLPSECRAAVERARSPIAALLRATHAGAAGTPSWLRPLPVLHSIHGAHLLLRAATFAALDARLLLEEKSDPSAALDVCVDVLALGRDITFGANLIAFSYAQATVQAANAACADALDAAPQARKKRALAQLRTIRSSLPRFSDNVRAESLYTQLGQFGADLDDEGYARLPPAAVAIIEADPLGPGRSQGRSLGDLLFLWDAWSDYVALADRMADAVDARLPVAYDLLAEIQARALADSNPHTRVALGMDWTRYLARSHELRARLDLLVVLAMVDLHRLENGSWPSSLEEIGALTDRAAPDAEIEISSQGDQALLTVHLVFPKWIDRPAQLRVLAHVDHPLNEAVR
jgi:hypothetical protein